MPPHVQSHRPPRALLIGGAVQARRFLSRREQAIRYGKSVKTIVRWGSDPAMAMPAEYWFGNTPKRAEDHLETWERARIGLDSLAATRRAPPRRTAT